MKLRITISKHHLWYLSQISPQIMLAITYTNNIYLITTLLITILTFKTWRENKNNLH